MNEPLSYTYRVLIFPIDESSKQRKNETQQTQQFSTPRRTVASLSFATTNSRMGKILFSATPRHGHAMSWLGPSLRRGVLLLRRRTPDLVQSFDHYVHFSKNPSKNLNTPKVSLRITPKWVLAQPKPNIEMN